MMKIKGKIINLGVGLNQTTAVHIVEEVPDLNFPINSVSAKNFNVSVTHQGRSEKFEIKPLRPELYYIRDVDQIKGPLLKVGGIVEFEYGDGVVQIIDCALLYKTLCELARDGETIYGKWYC